MNPPSNKGVCNFVQQSPIEPKRFDNRLGKGKLAAFEGFFLELLEQDQDMTLYELRDAPFGNWQTQTLIAGLTHKALIAPWCLPGPMDGKAFANYIGHVLIPEIEPGTIVILDNLATHRNKQAAKVLRQHGCWFLFLPPYSPDLNPIEMAFSKLKTYLRKVGARNINTVFKAIGEVCEMFSQQECENYFSASGY